MNYISFLMQEHFRKIRDRVNEELKSEIIKRLDVLGFTFKDDHEFLLFVSKRVTRVAFDDLEEVHYYLDFKSEEDRGTLIIYTFENRIRIKNEGYKVIATIG